MKRVLMIVLLVLITVGLVFAQDGNRRGQIDPRAFNSMHGNKEGRPAMEKTSVTGNLTIANGMAAIKSNDTVYLFPGLIRYAGFIEGLKDGARVTVEGIIASRQDDAKTKILIPHKLVIGNKDYDIGLPFAAMQDRQMQHGYQGKPQEHFNKQNQFNRHDNFGRHGNCPYCQPQQNHRGNHKR